MAEKDITATELTHVESVGVDKKDFVYDEEVIMKSPFDDFGAWKTASLFRYATFIALVAAFSACAE